MSSVETYNHTLAARDRLVNIVKRLKEIRAQLLILPATELRSQVLANNRTTLELMEQLLSSAETELKRPSQAKSW